MIKINLNTKLLLMSNNQIIYVNTKKEAYELITNPIKLFLLLYSKYGDIEDDYNMLKINEILFNKSTHFNILFKEYLFNCKEEYLNRIYHFHEIFTRMNKLNDYYHNYHKFFCKPFIITNNFNLLLKKYYEKQAEVFYKNNYSQNLTNSENNNSNNSSISLSNIDNETDIKTIFDKKTRNLIDDSNLKFTITLDSSRNLNFNHNELCSKRSKDASFLPIVQNLLNYNKKRKKETNKKINLKFISKKNIILFNNININHINYTNKNNNNNNNNNNVNNINHNKNHNKNNNNNINKNNNIKNQPKSLKNNLFLLSPKLKNIFSNNYITNLNEIKKNSDNNNNKYVKNNLKKFPFYNYRIINTKLNNINSLTNLSGNLSKQKSNSKSNRHNTNIYNKNMKKNHSTKNLMKQNSTNNLRNKKLNSKNKIIKNETFEFKLFKNNINYPFSNYLLQSKKNTMSLNSNTINFTNNTNVTNNKKPRVLNMKKTFSRNKSIVNLNSSSKNLNNNNNHFYNNMNRKKTKSLDEKVNYYDNKYNIYSISIKNQIEDMLKNTKIFISKKKNKENTYSLLSLKNTYNSNRYNNKKLKSNSVKILNFVNKNNNTINNNNNNNQYK